MKFVYCLLIGFFILSGCATQSVEVGQQVNNHPARLAERTSFHLMMKKEVQRTENRNELANALVEIFQEKNPDYQFQLQKNLTESLTRQKQPHIWAALNLIAANAYSKLHQANKQNDINTIVEYYENTLQVITQNKYPYEWAAIHNNLAEIYLSRLNTGQVNDSEKAITHANQALRVRVRRQLPYHWAISQSLLARAHYEQDQGNRTSHLLKAAALFKQVLEVLTYDTFPEHFILTVYQLCQVLFELEQYSEALFYMKTALEINENQLGYADLSPEEMQQLVMQVQDFFSNAVWAAVQMDDYETAFFFMEWGKGRMLRKNLALDVLDLRNLPIDAYEKLKNTEQERQRLIIQLEKQSEHSDVMFQSHLIEEIKSKNQQKQKILEKQNISGKGLFAAEDLYQWLSTLPSDGTIIAPVFSNYGTVIFILPTHTASIDKENVLVLPEFTRKDLLELMRGEKRDEWGGYIRTYVEWKNNQSDNNFDIWQSQLEISLDKITESWLSSGL